MEVIVKLKQVIPSLNEDQIEAITSTEGPLLIIAGPGTGKTLTLAARTVYLLLTGKAEPDEIILTTFTEKAAFELRDRVNQLAKKLNYSGHINRIKVGTVHSLCNKYIMKYLPSTPLKKGYVVLDEMTQIFFIYENLDEIVPKINGLYLGKWQNKWHAIEEIVRYFNKITEELIDQKILKASDNEFLFYLSESYDKYMKIQFGQNRIDFANLQKIFLSLLNDKKVYEEINKNIKYIMVDEYQDTNYIQEQIFLCLARPENNICVVGDEDQALYRFRGATVRNILEFAQKFDNCKEVKLTINYRSHKKIIEKYNRFITSINWHRFRFPKEIKPNPSEEFPEYPAVFSIWGANEKDEAQRLSELLIYLKKNNIIREWSDVAILLKSVRPEHSGHYIQAFKASNIPYFAPRARMFFEQPAIKLFVACFGIILGFYDEMPENYEHRNYLEEALKLLKEATDKSVALKDYLRRKANQLAELKEGSLDLTLMDYYYQLLAYEPFSSYLKDKNIRYNLAILSRLISIFQAYFGIKIINAKNKQIIKKKFFLSYLNYLFLAGVDEYEDPDNPIPKGFVQIMTIHQAKGLEFPVVIVGSLHKNFAVQKEVDRDLLPFSKRGTFESEKQMTEFDRIRHYYVAFTRAKRLLVLTTPDKPKPWFYPIWEGLDQYPYIEKELLKAQKFESRAQFVPRKTFSFSKVSFYETCPQQYLFYLECQFHPSRSGQIFFGSLVHSTIEDIHRAFLEKTIINTSDIEQWLEANYKALLLAGLRPISPTLLENAKNQVINYFLQNRDILEKIKEAEVEVSIDTEDYIITGRVDLLVGDDDNIDILDFKTQKKPEPENPIIKKYYNQLCYYAFLIEQRYKKPVRNLYIYWTSEERRKDAIMEFKYKKEDIDLTKKYFDQLVQRIRREDFEVRQPPDVEKVCMECDFRFYCSENGIIKYKYREI
jgi:DNA helicase-2/ATP-dependent DNA helicase PcrA